MLIKMKKGNRVMFMDYGMREGDGDAFEVSQSDWDACYSQYAEIVKSDTIEKKEPSVDIQTKIEDAEDKKKLGRPRKEEVKEEVKAQV